MCGLTGFWQPGGCLHDAAAATARCMADALVHRGPDDAGVGWMPSPASHWGTGGWRFWISPLPGISPWCRLPVAM